MRHPAATAWSMRIWAICYDGVTHQFFGLAQAVNKAMFAHSQVTRNINAGFGRS